MKWVFGGLIILGYALCCWQQWAWEPLATTPAPMQVLSDAILKSADDAVMLSINLIGVMAFFLGLIRIAEVSGLIDKLAYLIAPLLKPLFPQVPHSHPAFGAMVMNFSANILGAGNAATPFGIKAMQHLDSLNRNKGTACDAMIMFLVINTSSLTLIPAKVIAIRQAAGSLHPTAIIPTTLFATFCSTLFGILLTRFIQRKQRACEPRLPLCWQHILFFVLFASFLPLMWFYGLRLSVWILPTFIIGIVGWGMLIKIDVYAAFIEGAKQGFDTAVKIIPYLVSIFVALGLFRASGGFDKLLAPLSHFTSPLGLPIEALPMALLRPFSGSGSLAILADTLNQPSIGPDSYIGHIVSTMMGSTETTFYVLAVYFGAVQIKKIRYALPCALFADFMGITMSVVAVKIFL